MNQLDKTLQSLEFLIEMPQHYSGALVYQKDSKFIPQSLGNISRMEVLGQAGDFLFLVHPKQTSGSVFLLTDIFDSKGEYHQDVHEVLPVLSLSLRDSDVLHFKQAFRLRIRESYGGEKAASLWYQFYLKRFGNIVSDIEHLEGGKQLWKSFIKSTEFLENSKISSFDVDKKKIVHEEVTINTPENELWSQDNSLKSLVLVYSKRD